MTNEHDIINYMSFPGLEVRDTIENKTITDDLIIEKMSHIRELSRRMNKKVVKKIRTVVTNYFGIPEYAIDIDTRKRDICLPRQISMFFAKGLTSYSLKDIGYLVGNRDHASCLHAFDVVKNLMFTEYNFKLQMVDISTKLHVDISQIKTTNKEWKK